MYKKISPKQELLPYVESIWIQEADYDPGAKYKPTTILPTNSFELAFTYGDLFYELNDGNRNTLSDFHFTGQRTKPTKLSIDGRTGIILVKFYPWGISPFLKFPVNEITDQIIEPELFLNHGFVSQYRQRILEAIDHHDKAEIMQEFLLTLLNESDIDPLVFDSIKKVNASFGNVFVDNLARQLHISRRQLGRRFSSITGISPKTFASTVRFQKALYFLKMGFSTSDVIHRCGYYDQSHLIREFKKLANYTPDYISSEKRITGLMRYFNFHHKLSHLYNTTYL